MYNVQFCVSHPVVDYWVTGKYSNFAGILRESKSNRGSHIFVCSEWVQVFAVALWCEELCKQEFAMFKFMFSIRLWIVVVAGKYSNFAGILRESK
jgi:hypothetical protein